MNNVKEYDYAIVYLRTFAITAIVCHHSIISLSGWPPVDLGEIEVPFWLSQLSEYSKKFGLVAFTFISGFLSVKDHSKTSYFRFLCKKAKRVLVPCAFFAILYIFLFPNRMYNNDPVNGTHLWYLPMIFGLYMLSPLVNRDISAKVCFSYLALFLCLIILYKITNFRTFGECFHYLGVFLCGAYFHKATRSDAVNRLRTDIGRPVLIICMVLLLLTDTFLASTIAMVILIIITYITLLSIIRITPPTTLKIIVGSSNIIKPVLLTISDSSFIIYLFHQFVINCIIEAYLKYHFFYYLIPILAFLLSIILSIIVNSVWQKIKCLT